MANRAHETPDAPRAVLPEVMPSSPAAGAKPGTEEGEGEQAAEAGAAEASAPSAEEEARAEEGQNSPPAPAASAAPGAGGEVDEQTPVPAAGAAAGGVATEAAPSSPVSAPSASADAEFEMLDAGGYEPPFVDELPDPVTPYEQRSDTIKVSDLPPVDLLRGRVLANRYLAEEVAEKSALSLSYRAYHLALDRAITVRILPRGLACADDACQEVRRIASAAGALGHPNVAGALDFGVLSDGWPYLVTEHFQGRTLGLILAEEGKLVLRRVLHIGKQLARGLGAAHEGGLLHGMLNPDNVLVVDPGTPAEVAVVLGFGLSSARGRETDPPRSAVFGVPFYVSPEQAGCRPTDARSDIYSLGIMLYEMMTGRPPFVDGDFAGVLCQHLDDEAESPSARLRAPGALAKALDAIVNRCLRKEPAQRYQSAGELAADLERLEAAAARNKRRPMPEVKRPTATIHTPHRRAESPAPPEAKVIVAGEPADEEHTPRSGAVVSPSVGAAPGRALPGAMTDPPRGRAEPMTVARPERGARPGRVSVDQATIKISAADRDRVLASRGRGAGIASVERTTGREAGGWFHALLGAVRHGMARLSSAWRRLLAAAHRGDDSRGS